MNIIEAIEDEKLFGSLIKSQATFTNWKVFLRALFALPMDEKDLAVLSEFTGRTKPPSAAFHEAFAIVGRRGGKSFISAVIACYLGLFHDWKPFLSPGETGWIMCIAGDRRQAKVIFNYIEAILALPIFKKMVVKGLNEEIQLSNQISIAVKTCDYRTLRGYTVVAAICDEIAFWRSEGANPSAEILTALRPSLATIPGSLLLGISTPYGKTGPLYEAFRDKYGQDDPDTFIWRAPTLAMNPTIRQATIDKALKADHAAAKAEWLAEFREDLETFLTTEIIEAAVVPGRHELPRLETVHYHGFVDPSGGRSDSFTMGIAHKEEGSERIILDRVEERHPPLAPLTVIKEFADIFKEYNILRIEGDRYAGEFVNLGFQEEGIRYEASKLDKSGIFLEFEPLIAQGRIELLDQKKLCSQLRGLERRTRSGGKDRVDHYQGGHDDVANAAAGACVMAAERSSGELHFIFLPDGPGDDWEEIRERARREEKARQPVEDSPEVKVLCTEAFVVEVESRLRTGLLVAEVAQALGVKDEVLRQWLGSKRAWINVVAANRPAEIAKRIEELGGSTGFARRGIAG